MVKRRERAIFPFKPKVKTVTKKLSSILTASKFAPSSIRWLSLQTLTKFEAAKNGKGVAIFCSTSVRTTGPFALNLLWSLVKQNISLN